MGEAVAIAAGLEAAKLIFNWYMETQKVAGLTKAQVDAAFDDMAIKLTLNDPTNIPDV